MENYAVFSIETHLFFARIMKEHALFLEAGFTCKDRDWITRADFFRRGFEEILEQAVRLGDGIISGPVLNSQELVTCFTIPAEQKTSRLTGIAIDSRISEMERNMRSGRGTGCSRALVRMVNRLNERALGLVNGLIRFKENILKEVGRCCLFTANYPLLIQHILREAMLYRTVLLGLRRNRKVSWKELYGKEDFWNQIMMEHALFIRGLLDPTEEKLIKTADQFAGEYRKLLEMSGSEDADPGNRESRDPGCRENQEAGSQENLCRKSLEETLKYREFKTAGAEGILNCSIASIILPLLADHVLREANHYIRILKMNCGREG